MKKIGFLSGILVIASLSAAADLPVEKRVYKTVGERQLELRIAKPMETQPGEKRPCLVFFHGGGWVGGKPQQFDEQAKHLVARGMVVVQPAYRFLSKQYPTQPPDIAIQDAKSAMRWVRLHAGELCVDPDRIAAGGGSAGGHLAAFVGMVDGLDDPQDDKAVSARANALVLFNPVLDNGPEGGWGTARVGERYKQLSPAHNVTPDDPATIVFVGGNDRLIPVATMVRFAANMKQAGVRCDLHVYDGQGHGFFNADPSRTITLMEADKFLTSLGYLQGEPTTGPATQPR